MIGGTHPQLSLREFTGSGYDKGRGVVFQVAWFVMSGLTMKWWFPASARAFVLRAFGAKIGSGALVRHRVRIHWPWKLVVGENSWIGEGAWLLNLEPITIGADVCVSQDVLLCTGSHQRRSKSFEFDNGPIVVEDKAWISARATILRGVTVGGNSVVGASALVVKDVPADSVVRAYNGQLSASAPR